MADKRVEIYLGASSVVTCLGDKQQTLDAMYRGETGLLYSERYGMYVGECRVASLPDFTRFESLVLQTIKEVAEQCDLPLNSPDLQLIISTTKGNVELLAEGCQEIDQRAFLYGSAQRIAQQIGAVHAPIVISNACISGVSAFVVAQDVLLSKAQKHVVIVGCDVLSEFITSGFASFRSISSQPCRPYDAERDGLTLGEACGALLLTTEPRYATHPMVRLEGGAITNDANHISGPSRTGDGLYYAISEAMQQANAVQDDVAFVNTHGTATRYNDEMESKALAWAELCSVPLNSLKGYIGHTLGASGVVETILCVEQLRRGSIVATKGYLSSDLPYKLCLSDKPQTISGKCCVKSASGFGGCNAAIVLRLGAEESAKLDMPQMRECREVARYALPQSEKPFAEFIRAEFKSLGRSDMRFYKMSDLSKALYLAVERLLEQSSWEDVEPRRRAIILANRASSLDTDAEHQRILNAELPEGVSPAVFVYTLPNVAAGEMCIKHKIQGDNTFFVSEKYPSIAEDYARSLISNDRADAVVCGWCDYLAGEWDVEIKMLRCQNKNINI